MRDLGYLTRFAGAVGQPFAVYRPPTPGLAGFAPSDLGIAHFALGAIAALDQEYADLAREESAILALADAGVTPDQKQFDRLGAIQERLPTVEANLAGLKAARERSKQAPTTDTVEAALTSMASPKASTPPTPFRSLGEQLQAVALSATTIRSGRPADPRLLAINDWAQGQIMAVTGASEIVGADGGFLVQSDLQNDLLDRVVRAAQLAPLATTREIGAGFNGVKFNTVDETSRANGSRSGGVLAYWTAEGGQKTASRPKIKQIELTLQKLAGLYVATDELLQDSTALESFVVPAFEEEFAFKVDDAMVRGTGAGQPLGIISAPGTISVAKETGQAADTILYENLLAMLGRFRPQSVRNSRWFMNQAIWAALPLMTLTIGTGGVPVFLPPAGTVDAPFGTLLGRPIEVTEYNAAIGDKGDIFLADWARYLLIRKGGIKQDTSIHVYFDTDETAFRWVLRINGRPLDDTLVTPYKGSATTSPFVTLDAR